MFKVGYNLTIAGWSVNSADDPRTELSEIETVLSLDSPADACRIAVYAPPPSQPGLLEQLAGAAIDAAAGALGFGEKTAEAAFSLQVRGQDVKPGDPITIELTAGDVSGKVMTAEVQAVQAAFDLTTITGRTGMQKLADTRLNQVYENQSLSQIVKDLAGQAGVQAGEIETGNTYAYFVVHESKNLLRHLRELALREGMDLYFDADNRLVIKKFSKTSPDHTFYYGIDILDLRFSHHRPGSEHILVFGESPASNQGTATWHWLVKDITPFRSEIGQGPQALPLQDSVVRTKDAADTFAAAKLGAIKDQAATGRLKLLGNPKVKVGDAVEIKNAPKPELNGLFKVTSVRHRFNKREGYLTFVGFSGQGGAAAASGLLGALSGLAGGLGL